MPRSTMLARRSVCSGRCTVRDAHASRGVERKQDVHKAKEVLLAARVLKAPRVDDAL